MTAELEVALMEQALQIAPVGIAPCKADDQGVFGTDTKLVVGTSVATFNITSLAKEWPYGAYYPDSGFVIKPADDREGSDCKRLYTTEYTTASYRPYATFTYLADGVYRIRNVNSSLNDIKEHLKKHPCD